ncbi:hypothetical protein BJX61DRAFT_151904 [Aspergillus egyptiacus]|nr:hypothetical protein BJX61DRAFT_151904 [Aspergillus egyptiacus]
MPPRRFRSHPHPRTHLKHYLWPEIQLNIWILTVFAASAICLGIFAWFIAVQDELNLGIPWLLPYMLTITTLTLVFIITVLVLAAQGFLLPGIILIGTFILFVLWLTGLVETSLQMYGVAANINGNCRIWVDGNRVGGDNLDTMAWIAQSSLCNCWRTAFAFELVNTVFFVWMMVMAFKVYRDVHH